MRTQRTRIVLGAILGIAIIMILILGFHIGGEPLTKIGIFAPLLGSFIGGSLVLFSVNFPIRKGENVESWLTNEHLAWNLIGCGCLAWWIGECFWRYYLGQGQSPFPSMADLGYSSFPPLVFLGIILQPSSRNDDRRLFVLLDSLIAMGALLSIAWFLLLGPLAQTPAESILGKVLGLYYPTADIALLSCIIFLLLRGPDRLYLARARRIGLVLIGVGLAIFAVSDFIFNLMQNLGTFVEGSWNDLGWPLGMMTIGIAAYLRRFLSSTTLKEPIDTGNADGRQARFGLAQAVPYFLLALLFFVLIFNVLSSNKDQESIRPVLLIATLSVIGLVVIRQVITMLENERLVKKQANTLDQLEKVRQEIERRKEVLESGVNHLKEVQTRLANGDMRARAQNVNDDLWPLATGLNLMADRMMRTENVQRSAQKLSRALSDFSHALERKREGGPFIFPISCVDIPEMQALAQTLGLGAAASTQRSAPQPAQVRPENTPRPSFTRPSFSPSTPPYSSTSFKQNKEPDMPRHKSNSSPFNS